MRGASSGRVLGIAAILAASGALAGCSGGSYGFDSNPGKVSSLGNLLAFNSLTPPPSIPASELQEKPTCPEIEVQDGTAASRVYGPGPESNANVKYQFSMGGAERECAHVGNQLVLKVGVEGRALLGPAGAAGSFTAPVRVAVRDEKTDKPVVSKLYQVPVTIGAGETGAPFTIVPEQIAVPYISAHANDEYTILVGFDPKGDGHIDSPARKKKRRSH